MTDGPVAVGSHLAKMRETLRRPEVAQDLDLTDDEVALARRSGLEAARELRWFHVCPSRFSHVQLDDFGDDPIHDDLVAWAHNAARRNLVLTGPVGTGKTHAALAAVRPAVDNGLTVRFMPEIEMLDALKDFEGGWRATFEDLCDVDRLVLDDLGAEKVTDWSLARIFALVNRRWLEERPTVVTTNLPLRSSDGGGETLEDVIGPRTFSRLVGNDALVLGLRGQDRRRKRA